MIILEKFNSHQDYLEQKALIYAEKYGIWEYQVISSSMVYIEKLYNEGTFKHTLDLVSMKEVVEKTEKAWWEK